MLEDAEGEGEIGTMAPEGAFYFGEENGNGGRWDRDDAGGTEKGADGVCEEHGAGLKGVGFGVGAVEIEMQGNGDDTVPDVLERVVATDGQRLRIRCGFGKKGVVADILVAGRLGERFVGRVGRTEAIGGFG